MPMAMYKYNGVRLRGVPSWNIGVYPNAIIYYVANENGIEEAHFGYSDQPFYLDTTYNLVTNTEGATIYASIYDASTNTWGEVYLFYDAAFALEPEKVIWGNVDVLDDTGEVFLAGSEPVKLFPRRWWTNLLLAGLCSRPLPVSVREPVAYLYNGVRLPPLPEWDREKYPYAAVCSNGYSGYYLRLLRYDSTYEEYFGGWVFMSRPALTANYVPSAGWGDFTESEGAYVGVEEIKNGIGTIWTNFDLLNEDGTVFMAASDPVPVYE